MMAARQYSQDCYASFTNPSLKGAISENNMSALKLAVLVSEFAQQIAAAHEHFSKEIQAVISTFKRKTYELHKERPVDTPSTICNAWEFLLQETELESQAHLDAASLLIKNVYQPLQDVATHKQSQAQRLNSFRDQFETLLAHSEKKLDAAEQEYKNAYNHFTTCSLTAKEEAKTHFFNMHNDYVFQIRASNRTIDEYQNIVPQVLEELEEIYIDTSNTVNVAMESHALLLLTKANEQHKRLEDLLKVCRHVNPQLDISYYIRTFNPETKIVDIPHHNFVPADMTIISCEQSMKNVIIVDRHTESTLSARKTQLQKEAMELTSYIKQNQDVTHALVNICQRNLANHLYAKVYETQEDMCRKRNEIRLANLQLAAVRAQIDLLTPKQNGSMEEEEDPKKSAATIKGMWKKAFKSLKSTSESKLIKRGSFIKKKQNSNEQEEEVINPKDIDPVYSLLKCAADLPKGAGKICGMNPQCGGHHAGSMRHLSTGDSSSSTSKASSPSSSASHSPKSRRRKLNARMKSFSLDTPEPPKYLLGIDEITKKKSSSFTNTFFGAGSSPGDKSAMSAASLRKKFASNTKTTSLDIEDKKRGTFVSSPKESPKSERKKKEKSVDSTVYVVLYNFRGKEKDDMDLRAGWRLTVLESSDPDWWKGKCNGKVGYFPAKYVIPLQQGQRVFQVNHPMHLIEGGNGMKLHKDQIVLQVGEEEDEMVLVKAANNKQGICPKKYLTEVKSNV